METQKQLLIKSVLDAWNSRLEAANKIFNSLSDEDLQKEVSPGRNRALYLLGHLAMVHDKMLPLLNFGPQVYPHLEDTFLNKPDKSVPEIPSAKELRTIWETINSKLATHFSKLSADEWFQKHTSVSEEDFVKEPHRNRLTVLIGRTNHLQYHMGQVVLIKKSNTEVK
ncbi:MAG: DinB family protein [Bacteroidetes bacterium]|nr:DinB family protein [Bacteroidota bacterium]